MISWPPTGSVITNIQDPREIKRKPRIRTKPGRALSFLEVIEMGKRVLDHPSPPRHGPGRSVIFLEPNGSFRVRSVVYAVLGLPALTLWREVQACLVCEVIYLDKDGNVDPNPPCRCAACDQAKVKKPRGPKPGHNYSPRGYRGAAIK
jgi:hypothetical protein